MKVRGVVKGNTIVLDDAVGLRDGETVEVEVRVVSGNMPDKNMVVFERMEDCMEAEQFLKWALIHNAEFVDAYYTLQEAEEIAVGCFGNKQCLIRQFGVHPRLYYRPTTYTPAPKELFDRIEVTVANADD